jgi:hypothetical protein
MLGLPQLAQDMFVGLGRGLGITLADPATEALANGGAD